MQHPNFPVDVRCFTFNQSKYITDAMNGFSMQETDFPFICLIVDDASTDGEQDVIRNYVEKYFDLSEESESYEKETDYANITYARHKMNKNCYFVVLYLKENHYSKKKPKYPYLEEWRSECKYEALCEGDDYWIDPLKLQKQVDFMGQNPEYLLCGTNGLILWENGEHAPQYFKHDFVSHQLYSEEVIGKWPLPTASLFMKKELPNYVKEFKTKIYSGDMTLILVAFANGRVWFDKSVSVVYRKSETNAFSVSNQMMKTSTRYLEDHIRLFEGYNEYTQMKYDSEIKNHLQFLKQLVSRAKIKARIGFLANIFYPKISLSFFLLKVKNRLYEYLYMEMKVYKKL